MKRCILPLLAVGGALFFKCVCPATAGSETVELVRYEDQFATVRVEPARLDDKAGLAVIFEGTDELHYYARQQTAPAGYSLKVEAQSDELRFGQAVLPGWKIFEDPAGMRVEVYAGNFTVFVPLGTVLVPTGPESTGAEAQVRVKISGIACTSRLCLAPFEKLVQTTIDVGRSDTWRQISFVPAGGPSGRAAAPELVSYGAPIALLLAFVAGVALNIMPCVWPVIPIIVMRVLSQAKESRLRGIGLGFAFCLGVLLFFAALAAVNIILRLGFGTVFQWGDHFRSPAFLTAMALLMVVLSLYMFGVFTIGIPASVAGGGQRTGAGLAGSIATGFLAAVLATPCSFGILAAVFAWAQTQPVALSTLVIMLIGLGMAVPYALLFSLPQLLRKLPKPGRWMEFFKQGLGFVLLAIAVKLVEGLGRQQGTAVLYYAVVLSFCVWMWGGWVGYATAAIRKWAVRLAAAALAVAAGLWLLPQHKELIEWRSYDAAAIEQAVARNQPVLVEFMADWCLSCKTVEKTVYRRRDIAELVKNKGVLSIQADTTLRDYPATIDLKDVYGEPAVPVTLFFLPGQNKPARLRGILIGDELKKLLESLPDRAEINR